PVMDLRLSREMTIAGLIRNGEGMLVSGRTRIQPGDHVVVFCLSGYLHRIERLFN
ncbi:MAG: Trk system potassium transporter TrkA, partial [Muribaculaceae bacterium]|nr:Trk system potassium transporter TrkA [Muribaculaceae bacterium]